MRIAGISSPTRTAIIAGSRNTQARHASCHLLRQQCRQPVQHAEQNASSAARLMTTTTIALSTSHMLSPQGSRVGDSESYSLARTRKGVGAKPRPPSHHSIASELIRSDQAAGQLASTLSTKVWVSPPMTHAVISVHSVPAADGTGHQVGGVEAGHVGRVLQLDDRLQVRVGDRARCRCCLFGDGSRRPLATASE